MVRQFLECLSAFTRVKGCGAGYKLQDLHPSISYKLQDLLPGVDYKLQDLHPGVGYKFHNLLSGVGYKLQDLLPGGHDITVVENSPKQPARTQTLQRYHDYHHIIVHDVDDIIIKYFQSHSFDEDKKQRFASGKQQSNYYSIFQIIFV